MITSLQATGTPGRTRTFEPKRPDIRAQITELTATATPGQRRTFEPKSSGGKPSDRMTELTVMGIPGQIRVFKPKTPITPVLRRKGGGKGHKDDEELLMIALAIYAMGGN